MRRGGQTRHEARRSETGASRTTNAPPQPRRPTQRSRPRRRSAAPRKRRASPASALEKTIGYRFKDRELLDRSLTHISALAGGSRANSYQRLEFLGDHVLGLIISDMLFRAFPKADEGELSRRLADLVRREACADVARAIDLGAALAARRVGGQCRRADAHRDPGRRLRGADRRGLSRRRL